MQCLKLKIITTQELHQWRGGGTRQYLTFQRTLFMPQESHANEWRWERHVWSALTSLDEKVNVWERPDRLGSTTSPENSDAGLLGFESSSTDKLWNGHRKQDLLSKHKDWGTFSYLRQKNELMHSSKASHNQIPLITNNKTQTNAGLVCVCVQHVYSSVRRDLTDNIKYAIK